MVSEESRQVFFESNTVHIRPRQLPLLISRYGSDVRQLRIEGAHKHDALPVSEYLAAAMTLISCGYQTPRLRTVIFECSGLTLTVAELVERLVEVQTARNIQVIEAEDLECVAVGTYILPLRPLHQEWQFSYALLASLWPAIQRSSRRPEISTQEIEDYFGPCGAIRIPHWISGASKRRLADVKAHNLRGLQAQIARYSDIEAVLPTVKPQSAQIEVLRRFELVADWRIKKPALWDCVEFAGVIDLHGVRPGCGSKIMEWATELLAPNVKDFAAEFV